MEPSWSQPGAWWRSSPGWPKIPQPAWLGGQDWSPSSRLLLPHSDFPEDYDTVISLKSSFPSPDQIKSSDRNPGNGCAAKDANFPLLITLPQPSTKLSFNSPLSQHKVKGRIPARCFNGLMLDPGRKDFNNPKGWIWVLSWCLSQRLSPSITIPAASPWFQTSFFIPVICGMIQAPGNSEAQGHCLPLVFDGDQNCKSAFGYWLLSINNSPNYNDSTESTWPPINLQGLIFTYQHSNNTGSHSRRPY